MTLEQYLSEAAERDKIYKAALDKAIEEADQGWDELSDLIDQYPIGRIGIAYG